MTTSTRPVVERVHPPDALMRIVNPVMRFLLRRGKPGGLADRVLLLRYRGRRTGRPYQVPVGYRRIDGQLASLTNSGWRINFREERPVELVLRGEAVPARARLTEDPDIVTGIYERVIDEVGVERAGRELGIRINVDRPPTREELEDMIERSGLSVVWYNLERPGR